jgi:hypothetical protein
LNLGHRFLGLRFRVKGLGYGLVAKEMKTLALNLQALAVRP